METPPHLANIIDDREQRCSYAYRPSPPPPHAAPNIEEFPPSYVCSGYFCISLGHNFFVTLTLPKVLPKNYLVDVAPPFGNVQTVVAELLGSGGMLRVMRHNVGRRKVANQLHHRATIAANMLWLPGGLAAGTEAGGTPLSGLGAGLLSGSELPSGGFSTGGGFGGPGAMIPGSATNLSPIHRGETPIFGMYKLTGKDTKFNFFLNVDTGDGAGQTKSPGGRAAPALPAKQTSFLPVLLTDGGIDSRATVRSGDFQAIGPVRSGDFQRPIAPTKSAADSIQQGTPRHPVESPGPSLTGAPAASEPAVLFETPYPGQSTIRALYQTLFEVPMPDARKTVLELVEDLRGLELNAQQRRAYCPLLALGHGDLNAANVLVDAMDGVWLIDFATSKDMPFFNDLAKLEVAMLFEYTVLPITPDLFFNFAGGLGGNEETWREFGVGDWLGVKDEVAVFLLGELKNRALEQQADHSAKPPPNNPSLFRTELIRTERELERLIRAAANALFPEETDKFKQTVRQLRARLSLDGASVCRSFGFFAQVLACLTNGTQLQKTLDVKIPKGSCSIGVVPGGTGSPVSQDSTAAASVQYTIQQIARLRKMSLEDWRFSLKRVSMNVSVVQSARPSAVRVSSSSSASESTVTEEMNKSAAVVNRSSSETTRRARSLSADGVLRNTCSNQSLVRIPTIIRIFPCMSWLASRTYLLQEYLRSVSHVTPVCYVSM